MLTLKLATICAILLSISFCGSLLIARALRTHTTNGRRDTR